MHHHSKRRSPLQCVASLQPTHHHHITWYTWPATMPPASWFVRSLLMNESHSCSRSSVGRFYYYKYLRFVCFSSFFFSSLIFFFIFRTRELSFGPLLLLTLSRSFTRSKWMAFVTQRDGALHQTLLRLTGSFTSVCYTRSYSFFLRCTNKYVRMSVRVVWVWLLLLRILLLLLRRIRFR